MKILRFNKKYYQNKLFISNSSLPTLMGEEIISSRGVNQKYPYEIIIHLRNFYGIIK